MSRRVVVTGMGAVTPLGSSVDDFWEGIRQGRCGIKKLTRFDTTDFKVKVAGEVEDFDPEQYMTKKELKRNDLYTTYAVAAATQAMEDCGLDMEQEDPYRAGIVVGSGVGGLITMEEQITRLNEKGPARVSTFFIPMTIGNMASGTIAIRLHCQGVTEDVVTACATGSNAIGDSFRLIKDGYQDIMFAGGAEAVVCRIGVAGFTSLKALSQNPDPQTACRPFDQERDGFVMSEGSGILVLEELEHAKARGAKIYGEIVGYGATNDAHHITAPLPDGSGAAMAMKQAMQEAGITPEQVGYINAHGTSTKANEIGETAAIKLAMGEQAYKTPISSTKSMTGHMLGAAGAVEAIICLKALQEGFLPPTINYHTPDPDCDLDYIPNEGRNVENLEYVLSNNLGFGGHNAVLCLKKWTE